MRPFPLPGGDRAAREPRRSALGVLYDCYGSDCIGLAQGWFTEAELATLLAALQRPRLFPQTSSMGRRTPPNYIFTGCIRCGRRWQIRKG